ncbi:hypothetical protein [Bosea sp. PAMC 26642]|uniref:hypothetical protein n=1 Tax=Bosea sp. (strain PAMC 26642) TaxID=1792307 RepID=UPI0007702F26|nr:hypothetical protein [Bosea sp. PAMC 26642]AMJ60308.1 hypothetical protein AXW83_08405 [Bosea sp. PAMC 26642]
MTPFGYCERDSTLFWAEPLNALTNGAFIVAAVMAQLLWRRAGGRDWPAALLIALVFCIGIGSFLFHTMPGRATLLADVIPIQLFAFGYFGLALRRLLRLSLTASLIGTLAFLGFALALQVGLAPLLPQGARGSAGYGAFVIGLFGVGLGLRAGHPEQTGSAGLLLAGVLFAVSLTLRSLDAGWCAQLPFGLHWAWHLLNAGVLCLLLRAAIGSQSRPAPG